MTLYQRVRPQTFEEMVGQTDQINALARMLKSESPPHTFLFIGPPGCGKTTAARIAARDLGADELSIIEINSANNRGIDTARGIQEQMRYTPSAGMAMIYIIDELHMTTREWQNAMLKPLEDTPEHVFFFLCTTDPTKLAKALRTRCHEITFRAMTERELLYLLKLTNRDEELGISKAVLQEIASEAQGSARQALVVLERVVGAASEEEQLRIARAGDVEEGQAEAIELCRTLLSGRTWGDVASVLKSLKDSEMDPERLRHAVMGYMSSVLLSGKQNARAALALEFFSEPFYNSGRPGLVLACYQTMFAGD